MRTKKSVSSTIQAHFDQIRITLKNLSECGLADLTIDPELEVFSKENARITWANSSSDIKINSGSFTSVSDYINIYNNKSFQILLFDFSIIRCSMTFKDSKLHSQNFSWIPCPFKYSINEPDGHKTILNQSALECYIYDGLVEFDHIYQRSPIRVDYDSENYRENHPKSHIHIQNPFTRINTNEPICFNTFINFVISSCYPKEYISKKVLPFTPDIKYDLASSRLVGLSLRYDFDETLYENMVSLEIPRI